MPRKSLSQKISEALQLATEFNKLVSTLPPPIRETVLQYAALKSQKKGRKRRGRRGPGRKPGKKMQTQPSG